MNKNFELRDDGIQHFMNRIWMPNFSGLSELIMDEEHKTKYSLHNCLDKMYLDLQKVLLVVEHECWYCHLCGQVFDMYQGQGRVLKALGIVEVSVNTQVEVGADNRGFHNKITLDFW